MPRSRASSPINGASSSKEEQSSPSKPSPSVRYHPGLTIPSPGQDDGEGSQRKKFRYSKPRIGGNFQAKVEPFLSQNDKDESEEWNGSTSASDSLSAGHKRKKVGRPAKSLKSRQQYESNDSLTYDPTIRPNLGGLCIHRPSFSKTNSHDEFLAFSRNLLLQTPKNRSHAIERADYLWKNVMDKNSFKELEKVEVQVKKRGRKRKNPEKTDESIRPNVGIANVNGIVTGTSAKEHESDLEKGNDGNRGVNLAMGLEDDELMLEYLQLKGSGQVARAQFLALVHVCRKTAVRTRRRIRKENKKREMDEEVPLSAVLQPFSHSWRRRYERCFSVMLGDHRRNAGQCTYPYIEENALSQSSIHPWASDCFVTSDGVFCRNDDMNNFENLQKQSLDEYWREYKNVERNKELMAAWSTLLEKGQLVLDNHSSGKKPKLKDLCLYLKKAYSIPTPEDVYGKRDAFPKRMSQCLNSILDLVENSRDILARVIDAMYEDSEDGVDLQSLTKVLDCENDKCKVDIEEVDIAREIVNEALEWEKGLNEIDKNDGGESSSSEDLNLPSQSLSSAEDMASVGRLLSLRPNSLVSLELRIHGAYELRNKIRLWNKNNDNDKDSVRSISSMIKEANKINLSFPELSLLSKVHKDAEEWMDRASVALRSKISLYELESLVETGLKMPLGLTGALEKLQLRYKQACDWIAELKDEVPCPNEDMNASGRNLDEASLAEWLSRMRNALDFGEETKVAALLDLSSEGSRLPVDVNLVHVLQVAVDARNWSSKAKRWVPTADGQFKRGKIEDIQDHLDSAELIVEKASKLTGGKANFQLDFSDELQTIVDKAENWFETYRPFLTGDNRRSNTRTCCTYLELKKIVEEAQNIPSNLGNPFAKINRIHNEAELWMDNHKELLIRCGIGPNATQNNQFAKTVCIDEVIDAIEKASKDLSVDLEEAKRLEKMVSQSKHWFDKALEMAPKRSKRSIGIKKNGNEKYTVANVLALIEDAKLIPLDTSEDVKRLTMLLSDVQSWQLEAQQKFKDITKEIGFLIQDKERRLGKANEYLSDNCSTLFQNASGTVEQEATEEESTDNFTKVSNIVDDLSKRIDFLHVLTIEEEITKILISTTLWCRRASSIIESHECIFIDKRRKQDLDVLINEVPDVKICYESVKVPIPKDDTEEAQTVNLIIDNISKLVSDDLRRLGVLRLKRDEYDLWCQKVNDSYINSDKRVPIEALRSLSNECTKYPPSAEVVRKILKDTKDALDWISDAQKMLAGSTKYTLDDIKTKLNKVAKIKFTCPEYKNLRKAYQDAKNWMNKVNKVCLTDGSAQIHELRDLLNDHDKLLIENIDEKEKLQQALCGYCICRRPYDGFMIGCDECGEWYHGPCIGVTQSQGDKMDKYVCIRCCVKRIYDSSCNKVAAVIKKWCDKKELSKVRSQDNQKHQRKVRERKREIEKWRTKCQTSLELLKAVKMKKSEREAYIEAAKLQAAAAEDQLTLGVPKIPVTGLDDGSKLNEEEALANAKLSRATVALEQANRRFADLNRLSIERKQNRLQEDTFFKSFRYWAVLIKCNVLVPDTNEMSEKSRPKPSLLCSHPNQLLSDPMNHAMNTAAKLGIANFPDVSLIRNAFQCIGWSCLAFDILKQKPKIDELRRLRDLSSVLTLPEAKSVQLIKTIISRTSVWRNTVKKALAPTAGETVSFDVDALKELGVSLTSIPVITPEERILCNAILDDGKRHCICGSARDETTMICCSSCSSWFHLSCMKLDKTCKLQAWVCPACQRQASAPPEKKHTPQTVVWPFGTDSNDISPHAPVPEKLWPPFGLSSSNAARNILGDVLSLKLENISEPKQNVTTNSKKHTKQKALQLNDGPISLLGPDRLSAPQSELVGPDSTTKKQNQKPGASIATTTSKSIHLYPKYQTPKKLTQSVKTSPSVLAARFPSPQRDVSAENKRDMIQPMQMNVVSNSTMEQKVDTNENYKATNVNEANVTHADLGSVPMVEGLPNGLVEDAVMVARAIAQNIDIGPHPGTKLDDSSKSKSEPIVEKLPILASTLAVSDVISPGLILPTSSDHLQASTGATQCAPNEVAEVSNTNGKLPHDNFANTTPDADCNGGNDNPNPTIVLHAAQNAENHTCTNFAATTHEKESISATGPTTSYDMSKVPNGIGISHDVSQEGIKEEKDISYDYKASAQDIMSQAN